ncbi:Ca2+-binding protein, RTX toxin-related [Pseudooceanicola nitratireducens]|uniref:Ca2+-binding protein, RTX toxin-related n=3 Tax=Pseudooceanicola nitratireducens TaxID=517719 RepID=A0A1I1L623_9RHOB|nr:Ig-like domain-containing protein [Pseudooceanicola nitratireducens]SFC68507.1 Ca2+-binding protein, RTX toxin-related [Pseudooceanicola nitratireducens]
MTGFFFWDWLKHDHDSHGSGGSTTTTPTPAPDGYVEGTNGADTIGAGYTDSDGDKIDSNDALLPGEMGDDDIVIAGDGADVVHSGQGNDEVYGGGAGDTAYGGQGNDVIYGDESRDSAPGGSSVTKSYDCKDLINTSCDGNKWFDWGHLSFDKLSHKHAWDQKLTFELDKSVLLKGLVFDDAHLGAKVKITAEDGKILFEGQVNTQADAYTLDLNIDAAAKIELWTNGSCQVTQIDYHEGGFDGLDAGVPGADSLEGGSGDDTIFGNEENDTIKGDEGNDVLYGNEGDDSVEGGQGDDLIFGDNGSHSGPGTPGGSGERESFEWDKAPDPNGSGGIDNQDDISGGFTQNTGSVDVNFSVVTSNKTPETRFETDTQKVHSINTGGAEADKSSSMASHLNSTGESATYAWDFSSSVGNVSFRINDIDADSKVIIKAIGPDGILTEIDVQAEWGTHLTLTDADGIGGKEVVTHLGSDLAPDDSPAHSVLVNIPGPVAQLQVTHVQNGDHTSEINVTDIYFDALEDTGGIGGGDDVAGDDTLLGGSGDDTIYGNMGDDSIEGGAGADLIYGDNGDMDAGGSDDGPRESFNWQPVSQGQADSTVTQNTGSVDVTYTRIKDTGRHESEIDNNADLNTSGIDTGGETIDGNSGLKSQTKGDGNEGDFQWEFSQPVTNVDFNINDLDTNGVVTVKAWDADGNPIEVTLTGGSGMSLSDTDAVAGADQARSNVGDLSSGSDANNLQVSIAGPVSKIVVEHAQDGATNSGIYITDLYFNVPDMTGNPDFDGQGGDDTLAGGEGADTIYGEGGDDTFVVRSADEGAGDQIIGGNGPVEIFDHDVLDLRGAGPVTIDKVMDDTDAQSYKGTVTFADGRTLEFSQIEEILIDEDPVNEAPVAGNDAAEGDEDTVITIDVLENDSDPDGDALSVTDVTDPANGSIEIVDGKLVYTPDADFNGTDTVTYTVTDSEGNTDTATVTITVNPVNDAPVANDDAVNTPEDQPVTFDPLANDKDVDGDELSIVGTPVSANGGEVVVNPDGTVTYTPPADFNGTDTITYTVTDPDGLTDTATITVTVGPVADAPVAEDDLGAGDEDTVITIDVLENDSDPDGDALTVTDVTDPANGSIEIVDGKLVYTPDADFNGTDTVTYTVTDSEGNTDTATVTITVNPVNDAPVANDDAVNTPEDQPVTFDPLANDTDVDGDELSIVGTPVSANGGEVVVNPDGTVTYTPPADFNGTDTITYTVTDPDGLTDTATITVTVGPVADAPVAEDDLGAGDEDTVITIDVLENDSDPDGDALTVTDVTDPANGSIEIVDGKLVYTPDADFNGTDTVTYTVTDSEGNTDTATVTITVNPVNDAPVAEDDADTTDVVTPVTIDVLANDSDVDGDALTVTSVEDPANGSAAIVDGKIVYTPDAGFTGTETFTYTITDEDGLTDTATVTVKVEDGNGGNQDPVAVDDTAETDEDTAVTINALENDSDPQNDPLTITDASDTPNGTVQVIGNQIVYTPDENFNGTETITYTVTDTDGNTDTATVTVKVNPVNDAPVAEDDADTTDIVTPVTIDVLANDSDVDGDALTVTSVEDPANGSAAIVDGKIVYTPDAGFTGTETFTYTITDEDGLTDTATVTVKVEDGNGGNQDPVAVDDLAETDEDTAVTINALENDSDPQNDPLTITDASDTPNGTVQVVGNQIVYTPDENFNGTETITYTVTDTDGNTDTATVTVKVNPVNDAPVAEDDADTTDIVTPVTIDVLANDSDVDGDALTVTSVEDPANGTAAIVDGKIVYTPDAGFTGTETFTYTITDEDGLTDTATITVTVEEDTGPDGIVEGHSGDDLIDDDYEGDPEGDKVDNEDALDPTSGDDDIIEAYSGDDTVIAGSGDDTVDGGPGNDSIYGNSGDDSITSGPDGLPDVEIFPGTPVDSDPYDDRDTVYGNQGDDTIRTGDDQDVVYGGSGDDDLNAGIDDDKVYGGRGDDLINDPQGSDYIEGGSGDDTIIAGIDTFSDYEGDDPNLPNALYPGILSDPNPDDGKDTVYGGQGNDVIMTGDDADSIRGGSGDDTINGGIDDDYIEGNRGKDSIIGGHGSDTIYGNSGDDWINAGDSTLLWGQSPDDDPVNPDPVPENGRDLVYGGDGNDTIFGQDDDDTLYGGVGNDVIDGGIDDDEIYGESGNDTLMGGQGDDTVGGGTGADSIDGNSGDDSLTGGQGDDTITGGAGDDTLRGNTGADSLTGGSGDDVIDGGGQNDTIIGGEGADTMFGGSNDEDLFIGSTVGDVIDGGSGTTVDYDVLDLRGSAPTGGRINVIYDDNPENGTVEFYDADDKLVGTSQFEEIEKVIPCFTPGTLIATPRGEVPVETLREGDRVITRDNGIQEIRWFGHKDLMGRELLQKEHLKPVLIQKGSLGYGLPERDMLVSPNHRVLVNNDKTALYFEEREVLVAAKHLTGLAGVNRVDTMKTQYIHFMFDQHEVILSDGSWTESFQPGHQTLDGLGNAQRQEILELFPELATEAGREDYHAARRTLKKHEAKLLIK